MKKFLAFVLSASALTLVACGDDVTEVYENSSAAVLESGKKLSKQACDSSNVGDFLFVKDSSATFMCDGKSWVNLNGEDGKGSKGASGEDGSSCLVKKVTKDKRTGFVLTCGKDVVDTLWNGSEGAKGASGDNGVGCKVANDKDGVVTIVCGEGKNADTAEVYKAVCGKTPYDPAKHLCDSRDGQLYKIVKIKDQIWMAENLNYGDSVLSPVLEGRTWCGVYEDDTKSESDCSKYGRVYTWPAAVGRSDCSYYNLCGESEPVQGICPNGWHLPNDAEWETLVDAVGGDDTLAVAKALKSTSGWAEDGNGEDSYGFNAKPYGFRNYYGFYYEANRVARFWSSTEYDEYVASYFDLWHDNYVLLSSSVADGRSSNAGKIDGNSVRCIKN